MSTVPKLLVAGALLLPATPALGAAVAKPKTPPVTKSRLLWATVDACGTKASSRQIGVRGSMPGTGVRDELMFMRFRIQYRRGVDWKFIPGADTGFRGVGSATYQERQSGQYFTIPAASHSRYVLRGVVSFQWRRRGSAVLRAERATTAGHIALSGADPPGYTAATCTLP